MIISDSHKFVFVANPKTGGTSIENCLDQYNSEYEGTGLNTKYSERHCSLKAIYQKFPFIDSYFKFAIVRNPFDWVVSWYFYRKKQQNTNNTKNISFKEWLVDENSTAYSTEGIGLTISQFDLLSGCDYVKLNLTGKFENIQNDFNLFCRLLKLPQVTLPHMNKSRHKHYTEYYDDDTREVVAKRFAKDLEYYNYKFGE